MNKRFVLIYIFLLSTLYSQFYDVNISYEYNDLVIKDDKRYILENFNEKILNYFKHNRFSTDHDFLDIPLNINIIYYNINFIDENTFDRINCQILFSPKPSTPRRIFFDNENNVDIDKFQ